MSDQNSNTFFKLTAVYDLIAHLAMLFIFVMFIFKSEHQIVLMLSYAGTFSLLSYFESVAEFYTALGKDPKGEGIDRRRKISKVLNYLPYVIFVLLIISTFIAEIK